MTKYKYELNINDTWIDISNYVETGSSIGDRLDETLDIASFEIAHIKSDAIIGLDLSKALTPYIPVRITINDGEEVFRFFTADTSAGIVKKNDPKLYSHSVGLIEATQILKRKNIPDITITQPKSKVFIGSVYSSTKPTTEELPINNVGVTPLLNTINESKDITLVEGNVLKANNVGEVHLTFDILNKQYNVDQGWFGGTHQKYSAESILQVEIMSNGTIIETFEIECKPGSYSRSGNWALGYDYTLLSAGITKTGYSYVIPEDVVDQTITYHMKTLGTYTIHENFWVIPDITNVYDDVAHTTSYMTLAARLESDGTSEEYIYLDRLVDKILNVMDIRDTSDITQRQYIQSENTRALINNIIVPETTFSGYNVWDALEQAARLVNATVILGGSDYRTIAFDFLDDIIDGYYDQSMFEDETTAYSLENYNSGLESNAGFLIEEDSLNNGKVEPSEDGWMSVRANSDIAAQLTEDNAAFPTRQDIFRTYSTWIKGVGVQITNGTVTKVLYGNLSPEQLLDEVITNNESPNSYWDTSNRTVDFDEWKILENTTQNKSDALRRAVRTQGNTIYYTSGNNQYEGLNHKTESTSDLFGTTDVPRALLETIMATCADYLYQNITYVDYNVILATNNDAELAIVYNRGLDGNNVQIPKHRLFEDIRFRTNFMPVTDGRSTHYKHNAFSLGIDTVKFFNEQDAINDTNHLGKYIKTSLNKQGNLQYTVSGMAPDYGSVPKLKYTTYNGLVVSSRDLRLNKKRIDYTLTLSKDFINQNSNMRPDSKHRIMEISSEDTVFRQDIYREFIVLTKNPASVLPKEHTILSIDGNRKLIQNFALVEGSNNFPVSYGKADIVKVDGSTEPGNEISLDLPVNGYPMGTTVNLQLEFDTNRSAGPKIYDAQINSVDVKIQTYTNYTSRFGKVHSISLQLNPRGIADNTFEDADIYPEFNQASLDEVTLSFSSVIDKDNREKYGITFQFPHIPEDSDVIRTYEGISKYNGLIRNKDDMNVGVALLNSGYWPTVNETKIKLERIEELDTLGTSEYDAVNEVFGIKYIMPIPSNLRFEGYAVYETTTKELIYAVKEDIAPVEGGYNYTTDLVSFVSRKYLKDNTRPIE